MMNAEAPDIRHPVDTHVGSRIRLRRRMLGVTQQQLGETLGVTFQQLQKYEMGANRVSASRLWEIARALDVPVAFFFEGLDAAGRPASGGIDLLADPEAMTLARRFRAIPEPQRRRLLDLARALGTPPE